VFWAGVRGDGGEVGTRGFVGSENSVPRHCVQSLRRNRGVPGALCSRWCKPCSGCGGAGPVGSTI
jgi:hypothetical protein